MVWLEALGIVGGSYIALGIIYELYKLIFNYKKFNINNKHILITGGSEGLGLSIAKEYIIKGAKLSIISRSLDKLEKAKLILSEYAIKNNIKNPQIFIMSSDVTKYESIDSAISAAIKYHNLPIYHLICCAGLCIPGLLTEQSLEQHKKTMDVNYFGVLNTIKSSLNGIILYAKSVENNNDKPSIVIVSSGLGLLGFIGETSYAPTKFALRGLAETLYNELKPYKINIHIYYPGSIDTPGFEIENLEKPKITAEIEKSGNIVTADKAAKSLINGIKAGEFAITNDIGIWVLRSTGNGIMPRNNFILELPFLQLFAIIALIYRWNINYMVVSYFKQLKKEKSKSE